MKGIRAEFCPSIAPIWPLATRLPSSLGRVPWLPKFNTREDFRQVPSALRGNNVKCGRTFPIEMPLKAIIRPQTENVRLESGVAEQDVALVREVDEQVLGLDGPIRRETHLHATAGRPARMGFLCPQPARLEPAAAIGEAEGGIEQYVVHRVADPAAQRSEPGIGEPRCREAAVGVRSLQVGLGADHEGAELPVVSTL